MTARLDTTGYILRGDPTLVGRTVRFYWSELSPFAQGYTEAMLAELQAAVDAKRYGLWQRSAFSDIAPETLARIIEDCAWLCTDAKSRAANAEAGREAWSVRQAGDMAHAAPLTVELVDGKVHFREAA
jgi:hypothetical protein